jgi:cytochrome c oxidase assembly factor CtaG
VSWWCSATEEPWSWDVRLYPGIWLTMALIAAGYAWAWRHHRRAGHEVTASDRRKRNWFILGIVLLWLSTDWPLGTLGAGYLAMAHMLQYLLYTLVAAPVLMLGLPEWMVRPVVERLRLAGALRVLAKPVVAAVVFNLILIATHAPYTVDTFRTSEIGSMVLDLIWLASGFVLWAPLISPLPELRHPSPAVRCIYLFLAAGAIAMVPGGLLTFADFPLYRTYELAPRFYGVQAGDDQQAAGILMKIGNIPIIWTVMFVIFVRWAVTERDTETTAADDDPSGPRPPVTATPGSATTGTAAPDRPVAALRRDHQGDPMLS